MSEINCLRCKQPIESTLDACPLCGEKVTNFQRTYSGKLIDGKYEIIDRLGIGGMGEIFKVRHIHLNEQRVIKIMRANIASDQEALQRFLHEARLATMIKHRNLAMLYDFSTLEDGSYYMVWEFIDGFPIQKWIHNNGPMPPRLAVETAIQALAGLEALHQMGIIHRDISPENIMLSQDYQGKLLAKVIDFGIAKQLVEGEGGQGLTQTGMFLGKLKYASPEQAGFIKEGEHLDSRSDLYSFGVVFYEMLAGRAPFLATNPNGCIRKHATEKPLPFSKLNPELKVPLALEEVVLRALEKDRDVRQATAGDFIAELEHIRADILPDEKFGLGERRDSLTGAPTITDRSRPTRTPLPSRTVPPIKTGPAMRTGPAARTGQSPTQSGTASNASTLVDAIMPTASGEATQVESLRGTDDSQPTMVESLRGGDAAETIIEGTGKRGMRTATAEPTLVERLRPAQKPAGRSKALIATIAASLAVVIGVASWWFLVKDKPGTTKTTRTDPKPPISTTAPKTDTVLPEPPPTTEIISNVPAGEGVLRLTASQFGVLDKVENLDTNRPISLAEADRMIPLRLQLPAGNYKLTLSSPQGKQTSVIVKLEAGKSTPVHTNLGSINLDEAVEDIFRR